MYSPLQLLLNYFGEADLYPNTSY